MMVMDRTGRLAGSLIVYGSKDAAGEKYMLL